MKKFNPKVSIIIPVYNGSNYLREAIESALAQTYKNIEIIVVNDGSKDRGATEKIAKSYGNKIRYFKKENGGVSTALNLGIEKMTGEYFSWLSHDDMYYPNKIERQVAHLRQSDDKNIVLFSNYALLKDKKIIPVELDHELITRKPLYALLRGFVNGITLLIPKKMFDDVGVFNTKLKCTQDYDLFFRTIRHEYKVEFIYERLTIKRIYEQVLYKEPNNSSNEEDDLFYYFLNSMNSNDHEDLSGSTYSFYIQMMLIFEGRNMPKTNNHIHRIVSAIEQDTISKINNTKSKVTILTPVYNRSKMITEILNSVNNQTYSDYTYIIIDDGSLDNSSEIISKYIKHKPNWFYLYQENQGEAKTVNRGWSLCNSEYFVQINSDDPVRKTLLSAMVAALDKNKKYVLAYPDFDIIDANGKTKKIIKNPDFNLIKDLSEFSCYAASPGAFIRRSAFSDLSEIKDPRFKHTNDIYMLWKMALRGDFLHVPKRLAYWRSHNDGISTNRHEAIKEIEIWIDEYFSLKLPKAVKKIEYACRRSVLNYFALLLDASNQTNKIDLANYYRRKAAMIKSEFVNLQISDNDLIGNKFNGHDLHVNLRKRNINSSQLVWNKDSDDPDTYIIAGDKPNRIEARVTNELSRSYYDLDNVYNPIAYEIIYNKLFLESDVVHLHLMHNGLWDINVLPLMSKLKPIVWTIHDMWLVTGDRIASKRPDYYFPLPGIKNIPLNYEIRHEAMMNSKNITYIVASEYMLRAVCEYDLFKESRVVYIPFGLNFDIFYPRNKKKIFDRLGIDRRSKVVMVRGDGGHRKGIDYINEALQYLAVNGVRVHLIIVGGNEISVPEGFTYEYYGWLKDDNMLADLYSISDVYLMPSSRENFGMMAIEAMACGAIPVVIEGTALPETVNAPHCGIATPRDKDKYSHAVHRILRNDNERFDRSKASIEYVRKKHDMDRYLNALDSEYRRAINNFDNNAGYYSAEELIAEIKKNNEIAPALNPAIAPVPSPEINDISDNSVDVGYIGWIDIYVIIYNELTVKIDSNIKERGLSFTLAQSITKIGRIGVRLTKINYIKIIAITIASIFNEGFPKTNNKAKKKIISVVKKI